MTTVGPLNLFYEEPDPDRWFLLDRYPRRAIRRIIRGRRRPGGQTRVFLNLCAGLDKLGISYRINAYRYIKRRPKELACIIGKPFVLDKIVWRNPILYGAAVHSHPLSDPELLKRLPIRKILVPGEWMRKMWEPYCGDAVIAWPVGIDTDLWKPEKQVEHEIDFILYDKVRWEHENYEKVLIEPIRSALRESGLTFAEIRYGYYREEEFYHLLHQSRAMIFLCEHETQGIAYQQALACGVPILAWDRGGYWQDPEFYPERVKFEPVSSVPYWDERCGMKFKRFGDFSEMLAQFMSALSQNAFRPREFILENLTLEKCARHYLTIVESLTC